MRSCNGRLRREEAGGLSAALLDPSQRDPVISQSTRPTPPWRTTEQEQASVDSATIMCSLTVMMVMGDRPLFLRPEQGLLNGRRRRSNRRHHRHLGLDDSGLREAIADGSGRYSLFHPHLQSLSKIIVLSQQWPNISDRERKWPFLEGYGNFYLC